MDSSCVQTSFERGVFRTTQIANCAPQGFATLDEAGKLTYVRRRTQRILCDTAHRRMRRAHAHASLLRGTDDALEIRAHERVVWVGDVHGDLFSLLSVLEHARLVRVPRDVHADATACYVGDTHTRVAPIDHAQLLQIEWSGKSAAVVLLGDLLDNRRGREQDRTGVCGLIGTQQVLLDIVVHLARQARARGGRVVWVLGNHCCQNAVAGATRFCDDYAPVYYRGPHGEPRHVCKLAEGGGLEFDVAWREIVRGAMRAVGALAVLVATCDGEPWAVAVHGFVDPRLEKAFGLCRARGPADALTNAHLVNQAYNAMIYDGASPEAAHVHAQSPDVLPTWCRARTGDGCAAARDLFGVDLLFKAHDVQHHAHCARGVCFLDVAMGRSFHANRPPRANGQRTSARLAYMESDQTGAHRSFHFNATYDAR